MGYYSSDCYRVELESYTSFFSEKRNIYINKMQFSTEIQIFPQAAANKFVESSE